MTERDLTLACFDLIDGMDEGARFSSFYLVDSVIKDTVVTPTMRGRSAHWVRQYRDAHYPLRLELRRRVSLLPNVPPPKHKTRRRTRTRSPKPRPPLTFTPSSLDKVLFLCLQYIDTCHVPVIMHEALRVFPDLSRNQRRELQYILLTYKSASLSEQTTFKQQLM